MTEDGPSTRSESDGGEASSLLCVSCGYELRGLDPARACPECGTPIARSRQGDRLAAADPTWLAGMARGQRLLSIATRLILWTLLAYIFGAVALVMANAFLHAGNLPGWLDLDAVTQAAEIVGTAGLYLIVILCAMAGAIGLFLVTAQEPRLRQREATLSARRIARGGAIAFIAAFVLYSTMRSIVWLGGPAATVLRLLSMVAIGAALTCVIAGTSRWLASIAERAPAPKLAGRTAGHAKYWMWVIPLITIWLAARTLQISTRNLPAPLGMIVDIIFGLGGCVVVILMFASILEAVRLANLMHEHRSMLDEIAQRGGAVSRSNQRGASPASGSSSGEGPSPSGPSVGSSVGS